jgi:hypothetical protein
MRRYQVADETAILADSTELPGLGLWVPRTRSAHATCTYSCTRFSESISSEWPGSGTGAWGVAPARGR